MHIWIYGDGIDLVILMEFVYAFNRGRIFLRLLKGYEWYDLGDENNIVDKCRL